MSYLKQRPGSVEETITKLSSKVTENDYQDKFKKELEKAGKGIGAMTPKEKSAFFNKVDKMHKAKDEQATKGDIDKFHKKLDNLVHKSFGHSSDEKKMKKEEVDIEETHMGQTAKANQSQKDAKGEKEVIKPLSMKETLQKMWQEAADKKEEPMSPADIERMKKQGMKPQKEEPKEEPKKEEESVDKAKAEVEKAKDQVQLLKQKIEQEKSKQVQQRVNPETGEPLLQVGVAYKHLRDKMKEEALTNAERKKEEEQNKNKKTTDTGEKPSEIETKPEIKYAN